MHKSAGNVIAPEDLIKNYGAEILRLWVAGEDYRDNIRLSEEILQRLTEAYRRIRNTCRYLLGNLSDFDVKKDSVPYEQMEELDRWALHQLQGMNERVLRAYENFDFHTVYHNIHNFCVVDLSSFYLDILKDRLYTSPRRSLGRRSAQTAMDRILHVVVRLMAPILSFTADEIWEYLDTEGGPPSVHADSFAPVDESHKDPELAARWEIIVRIRKEVTKALEMARNEKRIGHSLDATVGLKLSADLAQSVLPFKDQLRSIFIVSLVEIRELDQVKGEMSAGVDGLKVEINASSESKCARCWVRDSSVGSDTDHPGICQRCLKALGETELK
jgi:isoleucyl-tRNA synthetase